MESNDGEDRDRSQSIYVGAIRRVVGRPFPSTHPVKLPQMAEIETA